LKYEDSTLTTEFFKKNDLYYKLKNTVRNQIYYLSESPLQLVLKHILVIEKDFQSNIQYFDFNCQWLLLSLIAKHYFSPMSFQPNDLKEISKKYSPVIISNALSYLFKSIQIREIP